MEEEEGDRPLATDVTTPQQTKEPGKKEAEGVEGEEGEEQEGEEDDGPLPQTIKGHRPKYQKGKGPHTAVFRIFAK